MFLEKHYVLLLMLEVLLSIFPPFKAGLNLWDFPFLIDFGFCMNRTSKFKFFPNIWSFMQYILEPSKIFKYLDSLSVVELFIES